MGSTPNCILVAWSTSITLTILQNWGRHTTVYYIRTHLVREVLVLTLFVQSRMLPCCLIIIHVNWFTFRAFYMTNETKQPLTKNSLFYNLFCVKNFLWSRSWDSSDRIQTKLWSGILEELGFDFRRGQRFSILPQHPDRLSSRCYGLFPHVWNDRVL